MVLKYRSNYQANPYAQPRKSTTVKYLGSYQATNNALPRSNLDSLTRAYMSYAGPYAPGSNPYTGSYSGSQYDASMPTAKSKSKGYGKYQNPLAGQYTPINEVPGWQAYQARRNYEAPPVAYGGTPFGPGGYVGTSYGSAYANTLKAQEKAQMGRGAQTLNDFDRPYLPWYARGWSDPTGFIDRYQSQSYTLGVPKSSRTPPGTAGYKYTTAPEGYTELPAAQEQPQYGYGGGYGGYSYPGYGGYGGYSSGAPSGGRPQQQQGPNVQYAGEASRPGAQPGYQLPQWYRKLLSWNF